MSSYTCHRGHALTWIDDDFAWCEQCPTDERLFYQHNPVARAIFCPAKSAALIDLGRRFLALRTELETERRRGLGEVG